MTSHKFGLIQAVEHAAPKSWSKYTTYGSSPLEHAPMPYRSPICVTKRLTPTPHNVPCHLSMFPFCATPLPPVPNQREEQNKLEFSGGCGYGGGGGNPEKTPIKNLKSREQMPPLTLPLWSPMPAAHFVIIHLRDLS